MTREGLWSGIEAVQKATRTHLPLVFFSLLASELPIILPGGARIKVTMN